MTASDLNQTLKTAGLRPSVGRTEVLACMAGAAGSLWCCEDLYKRAITAGNPINVSSIAHALADLERAGLIERVTSEETRKLYYRYPDRQKTTPSLPVFWEINGQRKAVDDPVIAQRLTRWLAEQGVPSEPHRDSLIVWLDAPGREGWARRD